jgi:transposase
MSIQLPDARQLSDDALQVLRLRALRGIELGYTEVELADLLGVSNVTISHWWTAYQSQGLDALPGGRTGRPLGTGRFLSDAQARRIRECIDSRSPQELNLPHALWTRRAVGDLIRAEFDIDLADRSVGTYLRRWGYSPKQPSRHAKRQDPDEVERWLLETYPAIERQAERENAEILWTDEVGIQADHHPGRGYARVGERATMAVPAPHVRVNQIAAISNEGTARFMTYQGSFTAAVFLVFLQKLIDRIAVFYLPAYSPEMNPVGYLNNDLKGRVNAAGLPDDRPALHERVLEFMGRLSEMPKHVISYFLHPWTRYAAPVELL